MIWLSRLYNAPGLLFVSKHIVIFPAPLTNLLLLDTITNLVVFLSLSLIFDSSTLRPYTLAASSLAIAALEMSFCSTTIFALTAVLSWLIEFHSLCESRYFWHCISPCGCEYTVLISLIAAAGSPRSECSTLTNCSPIM